MRSYWSHYYYVVVALLFPVIFLILSTATLGASGESNDATPPQYAILTNFDIEPDNQGVIEFHALQLTKSDGGGDNDNGVLAEPKAYIVRDIETTGKQHRGYPIYRAKHVTPEALVASADAASRNWFPRHVPGFHEKVLIFLHGFNVPAKTQFEKILKDAKMYTRKTNRLAIPVFWAVEERGVLGYRVDRIMSAPNAAKSLRPLLDVAKNVRKSIMCHSMGNFVLRLTARNLPNDRPFEDIFMVAADVNRNLFNTDQNSHVEDPTLNDGLDIASMSQRKVHVMYSIKDRAMLARRAFNNFRRALGARGLPESENLHPKLVREKRLVNKDCNYFNNKYGPTNHGYQFDDEAIKYYETIMEEARSIA